MSLYLPAKIAVLNPSRAGHAGMEFASRIRYRTWYNILSLLVGIWALGVGKGEFRTQCGSPADDR
jgi:hypothetical protein